MPISAVNTRLCTPWEEPESKQGLCPSTKRNASRHQNPTMLLRNLVVIVVQDHIGRLMIASLTFLAQTSSGWLAES